VTIRIEADAGEASGLGVNPQTGARRWVFTGQGTSTDIIVASGRAYMAALNKLLAYRRTPQGNHQN